MEKIIRKSAGVKFESDVLGFIDGLAREQQRSRSYIINAILRWYVKWLAEQHEQKVETAKPVPVIRL
jgi:predicted transcriptional regulator